MKAFARATTFTCGLLVTTAGLSLSLEHGAGVIATQLATLIIGMTTMIRALTED